MQSRLERKAATNTEWVQILQAHKALARARRRQSDSEFAAANALEERGYRVWYATIFGQDFVDAWAPHHEEAIAWHWNSRRLLISGGKPDYNAYFAIWSRGHMKSTVARRLAVADAALSASAGMGGYCLYVGGSREKTNSHALSVGKLLELPTLAKYYPSLTRVMKSQEGFSRGAGRDFRYTEANYVFHFGSLDAGLAGGNVNDVRPTLIIPDDIDERGSSAELYSNRALRFTTELLPMRQANTLVFCAQNLIQRNTIMNQVYTGRIAALANRYPTEAIPAVRNLVTRPVVMSDGRQNEEYVSGESTWHVWTPERIQEEIYTMGPEAFRLECQHEVNARKTGRVLDRYNPNVHVISWSQFYQAFGLPSGSGIPRHWEKYIGHDWGRVHPNVTSAVTVSAQNSHLPGLKFLFYGYVAPAQSTVDDVATAVIDELMGLDVSALRSLTGKDYERWIGSSFGDVLNAPRELARQKIRPHVVQWLAENRYFTLAMSHEQKEICAIYNQHYGLPYQQTNPGKDGGIDEINAAFSVDDTVPDPFRPGQMGYAGFYLIVADDQLQEARDSKGLRLWREQFLDWSIRETKETPTGISDDVPAKVHDDCGNSLMMLWVRSENLKPTPLTQDERLFLAITDKLPVTTDPYFHTIKSLLEAEQKKEWKKQEDLACSDGLEALLTY